MQRGFGTLGLSAFGFLTPKHSHISADTDHSTVLSVGKGSGLAKRDEDVS